MDQWVGQWVAPGQIIKNQTNLDLIDIIQFCLKIYDLLTHPHLWVGVWVVGWVNMWVNGWGQINLELIEISLKICDLLKHPHLWVGV